MCLVSVSICGVCEGVCGGAGCVYECVVCLCSVCMAHVSVGCV